MARFFRPTSPDGSPAPFRFRQVALELLVALSLAFLVWLYFRTRDRDSLDHVPVPVQITLAPPFADLYEIDVTGTPQVVVSFVGPPSGIRELHRMLRRGEVRVTIPLTVPLDRLQESRYRETVRVQAADIPVPPGVVPLVAEGVNRIPVTLRRLVEVPLPVHLNAPDERMRLARVEPDTILVRGPKEILERTRCIPTLPLSPAALGGSDAEQTLTVQLPLVQELEGRPIRTTPDTVKVRCTLRPRPRSFLLKEVPVTFLCPPGFPYRPQFPDGSDGKLALRVKGTALPPAGSVSAFVDLTRHSYKQGMNEAPVQLQLPGDCQLTQDHPGPLRFELVPTEDSSHWLGVETERQ
jgi:hypothetical protein